MDCDGRAGSRPIRADPSGAPHHASFLQRSRAAALNTPTRRFRSSRVIARVSHDPGLTDGAARFFHVTAHQTSIELDALEEYRGWSEPSSAKNATARTSFASRKRPSS